jgi:hypothetical protein
MFFKKWFKRRRCLQTTSCAYTTETVMLLSLRYRADKIRNLSRRSREARRRIPILHSAIFLTLRVFVPP